MKRAYILVEALVAAAILAIIAVSILPVIGQLTRSSSQYDYDTAANLYLTQGIEVSYNALLTDWSLSGNKIINTDITSNLTSLIVGPPPVLESKYTQLITIDPVCRNTSNGQKTNCPGAIDPHTKNITVTINWTDQNGTPRTKTASLLVYNPNGN